MLENRLSKNLKKRLKLAHKEQTNAFRLYDRDMPESPYIVEIYNHFAVVIEKGKLLPEDSPLRQSNLAQIYSFLQQSLKIPSENIIFKQRQNKHHQLQLTEARIHTQIEECGTKFSINLSDYIDGGIFLDHRPLRKLIKTQKGLTNFLNLFCYTGSMSVCAASNGARTTNIDLSKNYLDWAKRNFHLNQLDPAQHDFQSMSVLEYLEKPFGGPFDCIFLDPPTFSNSKKMTSDFSVQREHAWLINKSMAILRQQGTLYFSTNFRSFKIQQELTQNYRVKDITSWSIPDDFHDKKIHYLYSIKHKN